MSDKSSEERAEYVRKNRDRFAFYGARQRDKLRAEMIAAYGSKCEHCGTDNPAVLTLDHINDDAVIEKELYGLNARGGHKHYGRLKAAGWPRDRFQLLCYNCNAIKENKRRRDGIGERWGEEAAAPAARDLVQARIGVQKNNSSGFKGVFWNSQKQRWHVHIMINYTNKHIGLFKDIAEAARAYKAAAIAAWGDAANVPSEEEIDRIAANAPDMTKPVTVATNVNVEDLGL